MGSHLGSSQQAKPAQSLVNLRSAGRNLTCEARRATYRRAGTGVTKPQQCDVPTTSGCLRRGVSADASPGGTTGMRHDREPPPRGAPRLAAHGGRAAAVGRAEPVVRPAQRVHPGPCEEPKATPMRNDTRGRPPRNGWWNRLLDRDRRSRQRGGRRRRPESRVDGHRGPGHPYARIPGSAVGPPPALRRVRRHPASTARVLRVLCGRSDHRPAASPHGRRVVTRRERGHRALADQLVRELGAGRRPGPFLLVWRWRWELALLAAAGRARARRAARGSASGGRDRRRAVRRRSRAAALPPRPVLVRGDASTGCGRACVSRTSARGAAGCRRSCGPRPAATASRSCSPAPPESTSPASLPPAASWRPPCWAVDLTVRPHHRYANLAVVDVVRRGLRREQP